MYDGSCAAGSLSQGWPISVTTPTIARNPHNLGGMWLLRVNVAAMSALVYVLAGDPR